MAKVGAQHPEAERRDEASDAERAAQPAQVIRPAIPSAPPVGAKPERGVYRRVFVCATDPADPPNEERSS